MGKYNKNHTIYVNDKNEEVPSVTTILQLLNKPKLLKWVNHLGFKRQSYELVIQEYSDIGTLVHYIINCILSNQPIDKDLINKKYSNLYHILNPNFLHIKAFNIWKDLHTIKPIYLEESLVSDKFGGTIDFYGKIDNKLTILDFKTSKNFYSTMFLQLAGYCMLIEEKGLKVEKAGILIINNSGYKERIFTRRKLNNYIKVFKHLLTLFHSWYELNCTDEWGNILE